MIVTSEKNASTCEICGCAPDNRYARNTVARECGARYVRTRTNRRHVDPHLWDLAFYADRLAPFPAAMWAAKLACGACYSKLMRAINE